MMRVAVFKDGRFHYVTPDQGDKRQAGAYACAFVDGACAQAGDVLAVRIEAWPLDGNCGEYGYERLMRDEIDAKEVERAFEADRLLGRSAP